MNKAGAIRLQKEHKSMWESFQKQANQGKIIDNYVACPDPDNIFIWYFLIFGLKDCDYEGGFYLGKLLFPAEFPFKPPAVMMVSESGRFKTNTRICLSISDFHPESWSPIWGVGSVITGLISFMCSEEQVGQTIRRSPSEVRSIAAQSRQKLLQNIYVTSLFSAQFEDIGMVPKRTEEERKGSQQEEEKQPEKTLAKTGS